MDLKCIFRASPKAWEIGTTTTQLPQPLVPVTQAEAGLVIGLTEELVFIWAGKLGQSVINLFNPSSQTWSVIITGCPNKFGYDDTKKYGFAGGATMAGGRGTPFADLPPGSIHIATAGNGRGFPGLFQVRCFMNWIFVSFWILFYFLF